MARVTLIEVGSETNEQASEYRCRVGADGLLAETLDDPTDATPARIKCTGIDQHTNILAKRNDVT